MSEKNIRMTLNRFKKQMTLQNRKRVKCRQADKKLGWNRLDVEQTGRNVYGCFVWEDETRYYIRRILPSNQNRQRTLVAAALSCPLKTTFQFWERRSVFLVVFSLLLQEMSCSKIQHISLVFGKPQTQNPLPPAKYRNNNQYYWL